MSRVLLLVMVLTVHMSKTLLLVMTLTVQNMMVYLMLKLLTAVHPLTQKKKQVVIEHGCYEVHPPSTPAQVDSAALGGSALRDNNAGLDILSDAAAEAVVDNKVSAANEMRSLQP